MAKTVVFWGLVAGVINVLWGLIASNTVQIFVGGIIIIVCLLILYGYHRNNEL